LDSFTFLAPVIKISTSKTAPTFRPLTTASLQITAAQCQRAAETLFSPVSFVLQAGELAVISGANGSGKTTLLEALAGLSLLSAGQSMYHDATDMTNWLKDSHYLGHKLGNKSSLTCAENLKFVAEINAVAVNQQQIEAALASAGLAGYEYQHASDLSAGQKKRLALSRLLLLNKTFWLLDEPFVNLDHAGCEWVYRIIASHISQGGAVILTAHDQKKIHDLAHHHINLEPVMAEVFE
jgi:heme exporter protein A